MDPGFRRETRKQRRMMAVSDNPGDFALEQRRSANQRYGTLDYGAILLEGLALAPGLDLLDVACGNGKFTLDFKRAVGAGRVVGIDRSESLIDEARRNAREAALEIAFESGDALDLPYEDRSFDRVCCSYAIYHFPSIERGLSEMVRVARPGARLIATGPAESNNRELYELHRLGRGAVHGEMGRDRFRSEVEVGLVRLGLHSAYAEFANPVQFPSRSAFIQNYAVTKLFLDNVAAPEREGVLSALAVQPWPDSLAALRVTKAVGVFTAWI
jgi:SAM-dependent methyltransferase